MYFSSKLGQIFDESDFIFKKWIIKGEASKLFLIATFALTFIGIYTTIGIVRCTLGVATDDLAVKPYIPHKSLLPW